MKGVCYGAAVGQREDAIPLDYGMPAARAVIGTCDAVGGDVSLDGEWGAVSITTDERETKDAEEKNEAFIDVLWFHGIWG